MCLLLNAFTSLFQHLMDQPVCQNLNRQPIPPVPQNITVQLHIKNGTALTDCRSTVSEPDQFVVQRQEGFEVLFSMVHSRVNRHQGYIWEPRSIFIKPAQNTRQTSYLMLSEDNFDSQITAVWNRGGPAGRRNFCVSLFVYLRKNRARRR